MVDAVESTRREWWHGGLHPDLDRLKRAKCDICDKLGGCRRGQVHRGSPFIGGLFSDKITVELFEELIPAVFERSLGLSIRMFS